MVHRKRFVLVMLIALVGIGFMALLTVVMFKEIIRPLYKETYLPKKYAQDLLDKVRWIAISGNMGCIFDSRGKHKDVRDRALYKYIEREQNELNVEQEFCIDFFNEKEKDFICKILEIHKQKDIESFFRDSLKKDKVFYQIDKLEYYMFSIYGFLRENEVRAELDKIILYTFDRQDGAYRTYKLTEFGLLYQRLYYIVTLFCVTNEKTKSLFADSTHTLNCIKKDLENGEIKLWSYRP